MDQELQAKIEEARANGYSDEEINTYIANQGQPLAKTPPIDRSEEYTGLAQGTGLKALELGLELYGGKKLILDPLFNAIKNRGAAPPVPPPVAPTTFSGGNNPGFDRAMSRPNWMNQALTMARQAVAPVAAVAPTAPAAAVAAGGVPASYLAAKQIANMTPEQRRALYENPMLGAMGGDASLAAAIMNQGR